MEETRVWTFFYGSYINFDVLREAGVAAERWEVARLLGWEMAIRPRANLYRSEGGVVYGIVATMTHAELDRLYAHAREVLGETYAPEAVLVDTLDGRWRPALCYISWHMEPRPAQRDYIDRIVGAAQAFGFPAWYIEHLATFRPQPPEEPPT
jgi:AIG2 family protein